VLCLGGGVCGTDGMWLNRVAPTLARAFPFPSLSGAKRLWVGIAALGGGGGGGGRASRMGFSLRGWVFWDTTCHSLGLLIDSISM
jgi:hypothetical protein